MPFPRIPGIPHMQHRPEFPSTDDLCNLSMDDAEAALFALRVLVACEFISVYTSAGSNDKAWNVWLEISRRRVPLQEWAAEWLASQDTTPPSGGAA